MEIAILVYDGFTALDAIGPYEVLSRLPRARVRFVAAAPGIVRADTGSLSLLARAAMHDVPAPDLLVVAGGPGQDGLMADEPTLDWLRAAHASSTWTTSVCTGSLLLGAAGLLQGRRATSHWAALEELGRLGATPCSERVVFDGRIVTAAGVSAGIDMALALVIELAGVETAQAIQLGIEYDPQPPVDAGSPAKAPAALVELLRERSRFAGGASQLSRPA
ncbi:MAG: DJ-1/PfpI family protein [Solirubrobacteraceae bacterium]